MKRYYFNVVNNFKFCDFPDPIPVEVGTDPNAINYNLTDTDNNSCDFLIYCFI